MKADSKMSLIKVSTAALLLAPILAQASGGSGGLPPDGYIYTYVGSTYADTFTYGSQKKSGTFNASPLVKANQALYSLVSNQINEQVAASLPAEIAAGGGQLQGYWTSLSGPINIKVTSSGAFTASGMTVGVTFNVYNNQFEGPIQIGVTCTIGETFKSPTISGTFNAVNGSLTLGSVKMPTPSQSVTCTSDLDQVPFLGNYIDGQAEKQASDQSSKGLSQGLTQYHYNTAGGTSSGFGGVQASLPAGVYVFNGVDYGAYLKSSLPSIITSGGITATFYPMQPDGYLTDTHASDEMPMSVTQKILSITLPGENVSFSATETQNYHSVWHCNSGTACGVRQ